MGVIALVVFGWFIRSRILFYTRLHPWSRPVTQADISKLWQLVIFGVGLWLYGWWVAVGLSAVAVLANRWSRWLEEHPMEEHPIIPIVPKTSGPNNQATDTMGPCSNYGYGVTR